MVGAFLFIGSSLPYWRTHVRFGATVREIVPFCNAMKMTKCISFGSRKSDHRTIEDCGPKESTRTPKTEPEIDPLFRLNTTYEFIDLVS
jgi:hypothetical protein